MPGITAKLAVSAATETSVMKTSRRASLATAEQVAEALQVSTHFVYRAAKSLGMPSHRIGRYVRFDLDEVFDWVLCGDSNTYEEDR